MIIILALAIVGLTGLSKLAERFDDSAYIEELQSDVAEFDEKLASPDLTDEEREDLEFDKENLEETIGFTIEMNEPQTREVMILDTYGLMSLVTLLTIIASAGIVATEFSQGTIKMLLSRPVNRWKILMSKYATVLLFGLLLAIVTYVFNVLSAFIFFPSAEDGVILWGKSIYLMFLGFINVVMISTFAFMVGTVFRSASLAIGLSLFLYFTGPLITMFLEKFEAAKYIFFAHDLTQYETGFKILETNTMPFSIVVLIIYAIVFLIISFMTFIKRDITA